MNTLLKVLKVPVEGCGTQPLAPRLRGVFHVVTEVLLRFSGDPHARCSSVS